MDANTVAAQPARVMVEAATRLPPMNIIGMVRGTDPKLRDEYVGKELGFSDAEVDAMRMEYHDQLTAVQAVRNAAAASS